MGQQQLILLVLATVIVGVAIVIGVRAFTENSVKQNYDALVHDAMRIASDANAWKQKPESFGGQATASKGAGVWTGITMSKLGYAQINASADADGAAQATCITNENGVFQLNLDGSVTAGNSANRNLVVVDFPLSSGNDSSEPQLDQEASTRGSAATDAIPTCTA